MSAKLGADDLDPQPSARPQLLGEITGVTPVAAGTHVLLEAVGMRAIQRLAIADVGGSIRAAVWPAELKSQAERLYGRMLATPMIAEARRRGWTATPSPHIAFFNSRPSQRLYMDPGIDAADYARRFESTDLPHVRQYARNEVESVLWPWLRQRGYAEATDDEVLRHFLNEKLKRRPAHFRPGLRLTGNWRIDEVRELGKSFVEVVRADINAILRAAGEPELPSPHRAG